MIPAERLWVNPDCGLKARCWQETPTALPRMMQAARAMRARPTPDARDGGDNRRPSER